MLSAKADYAINSTIGGERLTLAANCISKNSCACPAWSGIASSYAERLVAYQVLLLYLLPRKEICGQISTRPLVTCGLRAHFTFGVGVASAKRKSLNAHYFISRIYYFASQKYHFFGVDIVCLYFFLYPQKNLTIFEGRYRSAKSNLRLSKIIFPSLILFSFYIKIP